MLKLNGLHAPQNALLPATPKRTANILVGFNNHSPLVAWTSALSIVKHSTPLQNIVVRFLFLEHLMDIGLYTRAFVYKSKTAQRYDSIDDKPFSTDFSFSRFLTQEYMTRIGVKGWVVFCDDDTLWRSSPFDLIDTHADPKYAVMVVKHDFNPMPGIKMEGKIQLPYNRKNWSSVILWNLDHPSNKAMTKEEVNSRPGSWLHGFGWLKDEEIGELPESWNWLVGHSPQEVEPDVVHFTSGGPWLRPYRRVKYADDWLDMAFECVNDGK